MLKNIQNINPFGPKLSLDSSPCSIYFNDSDSPSPHDGGAKKFLKSFTKYLEEKEKK